ncbi:efflux RND transporter permease subunit [Roseiconus nitratireducens]|uniref:Efflux RND transporter permease subunit n=1 Tax=Roseiconus nitratireducens TaxID=2605748 RepID=A0A5M6D4J0_9BACT|nr:efflux RND transporter permease subunit [Roseiconus nitratireducens]KAA5540669.1 efflux RND transporter permease subunit [Roseiconus nitratireducens]
MKRAIAWAISNAPGMNVLMIALMAIGGVSLMQMRREVFPEFELEVVMVDVPYPGATPKDAEEAICQKVEEAIRSITGIKKVTSIAREGGGYVLAELRSDVEDVQKVMAEIDREVNRIPSFPELAEDPIIQQITFRDAAIRVGIIGPNDRSQEAELQLREIAEDVRDDILMLPSVSSSSIMGTRPYQIDVEISEATLRSHNLTLDGVAQIIRQHNVELPGGQLKGEGQEILLRAKNKGRVGDEIRKLPLVTRSDGVVLTVDDLGTVKDEFEDVTKVGEINGEPAMVVNVERTKTEDLLAMVNDVRAYVDQKDLPTGYRFEVWNDTSTEVRGRLNLLRRNGLQGLLLVFLVLTLFLEMRLAFWVALGIPISILGAGAVLALGDQTLNMLSLFSFLMALGIVVDDAIVIGENIHAHRQMGKPRRQAALDGTIEVFPSVAASVTTTIIAFAPMFFVSGVMGKFMAVIPFAVIAMLVISLWESIFVLPSHLAHSHTGFFRFLGIVGYPLRPLGLLLGWLSRHFAEWLQVVCDRVYAPALAFSLRYPLIPVAAAVMMGLGTAGMIRGGVVPSVLFPESDNNFLQAVIVFPDGTPAIESDMATRRMEQALRDVSRDIALQRSKQEGLSVDKIYPGSNDVISGPVRLTYREVGDATNAQNPTGGGSSGSHVGQIFAELHDTEIRNIHSKELLARWRAAAGDFSGAERVTYGSVGVGPGGKAIEFKLLAAGKDEEQLLAATEAVKEKLATYDGVFDIADDNTPGKWEFQFRVKDSALATGVTPTDLGTTVRNTYFGAEAMRLQRGRHEVKLMVRYPEDERRSLVNFREIRVADPQGNEHPIGELAEVTLKRGFSEINRVDQRRSVTISADLDWKTANSSLIIADLQSDFMPQLQKKYPGVDVRWEGQAEQSRESVGSLMQGFAIAIVAMYVLLVLQFRSYVQPILILMIVPFGMIGAVWGHAILGLPLTLFSMFGLVALSGVVINDSIVLIDFINARIRGGQAPMDALTEAGQRRFRPILLTSMTTVAGLIPLMLERSFQAQLLIPMAASLAFGLALATVLVLFLVPVFYALYLKAHAFGVQTLHTLKITHEPESERLGATATTDGQPI